MSNKGRPGFERIRQLILSLYNWMHRKQEIEDYSYVNFRYRKLADNQFAQVDRLI